MVSIEHGMTVSIYWLIDTHISINYKSNFNLASQALRLPESIQVTAFIILIFYGAVRIHLRRSFASMRFIISQLGNWRVLN